MSRIENDVDVDGDVTVNGEVNGVDLSEEAVSVQGDQTITGEYLMPWAIPFKIHTPPVEDFGKVYHSGSMNFHMRLISL